jgi:hypothetical protein
MMPNHPVLPPPDKPHERPERRGFPAYRRLWWPLKVLVWAVPGVGALAVGYAVVVGDGAELPVHRGSTIGEVHVCPSAPGVDPLELWSSAAESWTRRGYRLRVTLDPCDGPPAGGVVQVRAGGDVPPGFLPPSDAGHPNGVFSFARRLAGNPRRHLRPRARRVRPGTRARPRARLGRCRPDADVSGMHPACGLSWTGLEVPR